MLLLDRQELTFVNIRCKGTKNTGLLTIFAKLFARMGGAPYVTISMTRPDGTPYGLPLSLARIDEKTFYFHCALEGVVRITLTEPPVGKRKQYDKQGEEMKFSDPIK